jgi:hypothetical protein
MTKSWKAFKSIFPMENKGDHDGIVAIKSLADMAPTVGKEMIVRASLVSPCYFPDSP